nr:HAD family hydrolase [Butyrivibrio sp.]
MEKFGIRKYIDVIVASAEEGVAKPDRRMFEIALERANCSADQAVMIGDRIDYDIVPAKNMGMKTIWVKQGMGQYWIFSDESERPDYEVDSLSELLEVL